jgi:hypothetical protein
MDIRTIWVGLMASCLVGCAQATTSSTEPLAQSKVWDFTPDHWIYFTANFEDSAGVSGKANADDILLLTCRERDHRTAMTLQLPGLVEKAAVTMAFDGGTSFDAEMIGMNGISNKNTVFVMPDGPNLRAWIQKASSSKTVEIALVESGIVQSRHVFTLSRAPEAIAAALKLCGQ